MLSTVPNDTEEFPPSASQNGLAEAFADIALRHGRSLSAADIMRRQPYDPRGTTLSSLGEVASDLGFDVHVATMPLKAVPTVTLPVIIFDADGRAMLLTKLSIKRNEATVVVPIAGKGEHRCKLRDLAKTHSGIVVFIKPSSNAYSAPEGASLETKGHWFWSTFRAF